MSLSVAEAAGQLGISTSAVRYQINSGKLRGRLTNKGWRVYGLNGDAPEKEETQHVDTIEIIADEMIALGRRLKRALKVHDERVRQEAITDFATTLAETVQKGR
jgi:hypothetical protein